MNLESDDSSAASIFADDNKRFVDAKNVSKSLQSKLLWVGNPCWKLRQLQRRFYDIGIEYWRTTSRTDSRFRAVYQTRQSECSPLPHNKLQMRLRRTRMQKHTSTQNACVMEPTSRLTNRRFRSD
eukprot:GHVR01158976.1.p1 GENE.GHVR01158976.1~~GHVR01158976.1.p1  ORF type:complete len:125 (-),score=3.93 GHVR01158976.1:191-565(-)